MVRRDIQFNVCPFFIPRPDHAYKTTEDNERVYSPTYNNVDCCLPRNQKCKYKGRCVEVACKEMIPQKLE